MSTRLLLKPTGEGPVSGRTWHLQSNAVCLAAAHTAAACTAAAHTAAALLGMQAPSVGSSRVAKQLQGYSAAAKCGFLAGGLLRSQSAEPRGFPKAASLDVRGAGG